MKIIRFFIIISIILYFFASCQKRAAFHTNQSLEHYKDIMEFFANIEENNVNEIIHQYIINHLKKSDAIIEEYQFADETTSITATNVVCRFYPQHSRRVIIISPYSPVGINNTAYFEAETKRIAYSIGLMLETASMLSSQIPNQYGVDLVFGGTIPDLYPTRSCSQAFRNLIANYGKVKPELGIFLWLHPSEKMSVPIDDHSYQKLPYIVHRIWTTAEDLGWREFEKSLEASSLFEGEELLYRELNTIKLKNRYEEDKEVLPEHLTSNFRILGSLFKELIYGKDR